MVILLLAIAWRSGNSLWQCHSRQNGYVWRSQKAKPKAEAESRLLDTQYTLPTFEIDGFGFAGGEAL